jgi:transposase-like protein
MLPANLTSPVYTDAEKAREYLESVRWPDGPVCPHCGVVDSATLMQGKAHRAGLYQCKECAKQFSVMVGTLYERSHIPLNKWLLATHLLCSSKKGISAHQLWRNLGFGSYRTAWFMAHRIREGMAPARPEPIGGEGKVVEADSAYIGGKEKNKHRRKRNAEHSGPIGKQTVFALVERKGGVRSHHMATVSARTLRPILNAHLKDSKKTALMTDGDGQYRILVDMFGSHEFVNHSDGEYVRGNVHTNTVEGYFATLKRGINGVYHHVSEAHLKRYLAEFDFRYNERSALGIEDNERTVKALKGIEGKRLTYRISNSQTAA